MDPMFVPAAGESTPSPTSWLENLPIQKQVVKTNQNQQNDPHALAIQGDWRAYLDERSGMVYYFNTRTGLSQWEPPNINFPGISLKSFRGNQKAQNNQDQSRSKSPENNLLEVASVSAGFSVLGSALRKIFTDITEGSARKYQKKHPQNNQNNNNWWSSLFQGSEKLSAKSSERAPTKSQNLLVGENDQEKEQQQHRRRTSENLYDWLDDLSFAFSRDSTRTRTLIRNQHADRDKESLRLKRLNDHYNRQENLRKTYEPVTVDRSPTFSLTRIKKTSNNKHEWLKYLD
jgi:hypothetical protein